MQVWHQIRRVNVSTLSTFRVRPTKRPPRLPFIRSPCRNRGGSLGTSLSRPHKLRARQSLILVSSLPGPLCTDMSARRPYSTNETNGKQPLVNGTEKSEVHRHAELNHHHETPHSHSHSIFGHSHSNGVEAHTHGTEQIIAALEGKGLFVLTIGFPFPFLNIVQFNSRG
jgi:hypothetical protein